MIACVLAVAAPQAAIAQCEREWAPGLGISGLDGWANAMTVFNDGSGDALYVAGRFPVAGNALASNIAKWNGKTWSALGSGIAGDFTKVYALAVFDDGGGPALYAGGQFTMAGGVAANGIAKWDGSMWTPLDTGLGGMEPIVYALAVFDDGSGPALYAGGKFTAAGGVDANHVAKWNGKTWSALGSGIGGTYSYVNALTVFDDGGGPALYAGGGFSIAKWNGSNWSPVGSGVSGTVRALTVFDDGSGPALYAGGRFGSAGGVSASSIAKWNGSSWSHLGTGLGHDPVKYDWWWDIDANAMTVFDDGGGPALYVGGFFTTAGGMSANFIAKWNGTAWSALGTGLYDEVRALTVFDDGQGAAMYAGGAFRYAEGLPASGIGKWNGAIWSSVGSGIDLFILDLTVFDDGSGLALYAGGDFTSVGEVGANYIAKWTGTTWSALGSGMNGRVYALNVFDDGTGPALYAGGSFTIAGGVSVNYIAKWNGTAWSSLGTGMNRAVYALTVFDDGGGPALYAGGAFSIAGRGYNAQYLARWDGMTWSEVGSGIGSYVHALAVFDDGSGPALYAGGSYTPVGEAATKTLAKWDGTTWSPVGLSLTDWVGNPMSSRVFALAVFDGGGGPALYAGGSFIKAGGAVVNNVAKWNGTSWSALGTGIDSNVYKLRVFDDGDGPALYAGGSFSSAGRVSADDIAKWNGSRWSPLGTGMGGLNANVRALVGFDDGGGPALYAGGTFTTAGGKVSGYLAKWSCVRRGDMNQDSVVDLSDFAVFFDCIGGPSQPVEETACVPGDINSDYHIDLLDFATFQRTLGQ